MGDAKPEYYLVVFRVQETLFSLVGTICYRKRGNPNLFSPVNQRRMRVWHSSGAECL